MALASGSCQLMNSSARVRCPLSHGARRGATVLSLSTAAGQEMIDQGFHGCYCIGGQVFTAQNDPGRLLDREHNLEKLDGVEVETRIEERRRIFNLNSSADLARESAENDGADLASNHDPERVGPSPGPGSKKDPSTPHGAVSGIM